MNHQLSANAHQFSTENAINSVQDFYRVHRPFSSIERKYLGQLPAEKNSLPLHGFISKAFRHSCNSCRIKGSLGNIFLLLLYMFFKSVGCKLASEVILTNSVLSVWANNFTHDNQLTKKERLLVEYSMVHTSLYCPSRLVLTTGKPITKE